MIWDFELYTQAPVGELVDALSIGELVGASVGELVGVSVGELVGWCSSRGTGWRMHQSENWFLHQSFAVNARRSSWARDCS
jgi:hypothetical protein